MTITSYTITITMDTITITMTYNNKNNSIQWVNTMN